MIIIPMAGLSSRFTKAGYTLPKYQLTIGSQTVFELAILSFKLYFNKEKIIFVIRDICNTKEFIEQELLKLGVTYYDIIVLDRETKGQAETVYLACKELSNDTPITIFNIDTFRYNYTHPDFVENNDCDGYLEVFRAEGEHWSFVEPRDEINVLRTTEKDRISDLCSDGLYYFKSKETYERIYERAESNNLTTKGEYYIAPLYNMLIAEQETIKYRIIELDDIDFCGTPAEYELLLDKHEALNKEVSK